MAEIQQKIISCPKGHYYDANRYSSCPYCSTGGFPHTVDPFTRDGANNVSNLSREEIANSDVYNPFSVTQPPVKVSTPAEKMGSTQFVDTSTPVGAPAPVVGWVVAVAGPCRGTDYRIHTGYNHIGRETGDICIHGDATISAEKDANITYVPQTGEFYIAHELGKNVLLVNNVPVIGGGVKLNRHDRITIGTTQLMFVPLCGEEFNWNDEGNKDG